MKIKQRLYVSALVFVFAFAMASNAQEAPKLSFKFTTIDVPGALRTTPFGINNTGVVVGQYQAENGFSYGYILDGKKLTRLSHGTRTIANGINLNGPLMVVGEFTPKHAGSAGFLYKDGKFTNIRGPKGSTFSIAYGINDRGSIVGMYIDASNVTHGFLLKGAKYTTLDVPGAESTVARGINDSGLIIVQWEDSDSMSEASIYDGKTYKKIDVPIAFESIPQGIDSTGDVVFSWKDDSEFQHAALLHAGKYYKFDHPKAALTYGGGINDNDAIVGGWQVVTDGPFQGFEATY